MGRRRIALFHRAVQLLKIRRWIGTGGRRAIEPRQILLRIDARDRVIQIGDFPRHRGQFGVPAAHAGGEQHHALGFVGGMINGEFAEDGVVQRFLDDVRSHGGRQ